MVSAYVEKDPSAYVNYLVSAKHVLQDKNGNYYSNIYIRLNMHNGRSEYINIPIRIVYEHYEEEVDIVSLPISPDPRKYAYITIPDSMISTKDMISKLEIVELY